METIRIEKRFKQKILDRLNPENATEKESWYYIDKPCALCKAFSCEHCPFGEMETTLIRGCVNWIEEAIGGYSFGMDSNEVYWNGEYDTKVRLQLKELREKIVELIIWI